ncbi:MAG UNVERIFIED_CONTAM: hypothetical protein LVR29_03445 [Microcystis novacekii LVE1205-3]
MVAVGKTYKMLEEGHSLQKAGNRRGVLDCSKPTAGKRPPEGREGLENRTEEKS